MNLERYRDTFWYVSGLLKFLAILGGMGFVISLGYLIITGKPIDTRAHESLVYLIRLDFTSGANNSDKAAATFFTQLVGLPIFVGVMWIASRIFSDISAGKTPFSALQLKRFNRIAKIVLLVALAKSWVYSFFLTILAKPMAIQLILSLDELFIIGLILYCFSGIIHYGVALQEFADDAV